MNINTLLITCNVILGIIFSTIGFTSGNIGEGIGWMCSALGWTNALMSELKYQD